jgi:hypothetical protein
MKNLFLTFSLVAIFFAATTSFAQDPVEDKSGEQIQSKTQTATKTQAKNQNKTKTATKTQTKGQHGVGFVDANSDGFNDNAPDHDGDGIPNGQDSDYEGSKARNGNKSKGFVDADGDGVNDNAMDSDGDGIPNGQDSDYVRPQDGSGQGKGMKGAGNGSGTGDCDGTGPKGNQKRGGKK